MIIDFFGIVQRTLRKKEIIVKIRIKNLYYTDRDNTE